MKKINLSKNVKQYLKLIVGIIAVLFVFYYFTKFGGFIFMCYGLILGTILASVVEYLSEYQKELHFKELEEKYNKLIKET